MIEVAESAHGGDGGEDADVDEDAGERSYSGNQLKEKLQLVGEMNAGGLRRLRGQAVSDDGVGSEEERLRGDEPGEALDDEVVLMLDALADEIVILQW